MSVLGFYMWLDGLASHLFLELVLCFVVTVIKTYFILKVLSNISLTSKRQI